MHLRRRSDLPQPSVQLGGEGFHLHGYLFGVGGFQVQSDGGFMGIGVQGKGASPYSIVTCTLLSMMPAEMA